MSRAGLKRIASPKISVSGVKATLVPRRLGAAPIWVSGVVAWPLAKVWR